MWGEKKKEKKNESTGMLQGYKTKCRLWYGEGKVFFFIYFFHK